MVFSYVNFFPTSTIKCTDVSYFYSRHKNLDDLAQLADKTVEMASPSPAGVAVIITPELEHLSKEITELTSVLQGLKFSKQSVYGIQRSLNL